jgi:hypothetical protein
MTDASTPAGDWATHDGPRIALADRFHAWRETWDELQQQRAGGAAAHADLVRRLGALETEIDRLLDERDPLPPV